MKHFDHSLFFQQRCRRSLDQNNIKTLPIFPDVYARQNEFVHNLINSLAPMSDSPISGISTSWPILWWHLNYMLNSPVPPYISALKSRHPFPNTAASAAACGWGVAQPVKHSALQTFHLPGNSTYGKRCSLGSRSVDRSNLKVPSRCRVLALHFLRVYSVYVDGEHFSYVHRLRTNRCLRITSIYEPMK